MRPGNGSLEFLRRASRRRRLTQPGVESIPEYVEHHAALLTPEHLDELRAKLPLLNLQFAAIEAPRFPHLLQHLKLLADFFEDTADGCLLTSRHTAMIKPEAIAGELGADATVQTARDYIQTALTANSRATMEHAKAFAEAAKAG